MLILLGFAFLAGVVTVLSPCILPVLPVVLASAFGTHRWRPLGVVTGLVASFALFTLALTSLVALSGISPDALRLAGALVIGLFGLVIVVPALLARFEALSSRLANVGGPRQAGGGYWGGALLGASLGLVWAPCAGPILASVTTLVATNQLSLAAVAITLAYSLGIGVPMLLVAYGGRRVVARARGLNRHAASLQRAFGAIMVAFALTFFLGLDRAVTTALTQAVPPEWTRALTSLEDQPQVRSALDALQGRAAAPTTAAPVAVASAPAPAPAGPRANLPDLGPAPELKGIVGWINGEPVTLAALRGHVVLVDFWTYSCINCLRTLPHVTAWDQQYRDAGLVVIGVHTPEFEFEKSRDNVALATQQLGIKYLVAQDNNYATWQAFNNLYWPAKYIVDAQGRLRYRHFGEGGYEETSKVIADLLAEAGASVAAAAPNLPAPAAADPGTFLRMQTPETYLGADRQDRLASPEPVLAGKAQRYSLPGDLRLHDFALAGEWTVGSQEVTAGADASLDLSFFADQVYLVLTPPPGGAGRVAVELDGKEIGAATAGGDVRAGSVAVGEARLYHLVDLHGDLNRHRLTLRFLDQGTRAYAFTFG